MAPSGPSRAVSDGRSRRPRPAVRTGRQNSRRRSAPKNGRSSRSLSATSRSTMTYKTFITTPRKTAPVILGIDPGTSRVGYGLIRGSGTPTLIDCGLLRVRSSPSSSLHHLHEIAQARGVILLAAERHGIPLAEYAPSSVKKAVTGYGAADKKGVARMVKSILHVPKIEGPDDVTDALAVAITAAGEYRFHR